MKQIIQAIKGVKEKRLEDIRNRCIEELEGCRTVFEDIIKDMKTKK